MVLYTLHLFAGAGGGLLADLRVGHRPIGAVEIDPYCRQVPLCAAAAWTILKTIIDKEIPDYD